MITVDSLDKITAAATGVLALWIAREVGTVRARSSACTCDATRSKVFIVTYFLFYAFVQTLRRPSTSTLPG